MADETTADGKGGKHPEDTQPKIRPPGFVAAPQSPPERSEYELGAVELHGDERPKKSGAAGGLVAWILLLLTVAGVTYAVLRYYLPLQEELAELKASLAAAQKDNDSYLDQVKTLQSSQAELAAQVEKREQELQALTATQDELARKLDSEIQKGNVAIKQSQGQIVVDLVDKIMFPSGEAELSDQGKEILKQVGETFLKVPDKVIQVGGHTDDVPISPKLKDRFPSNWELSAARALNVVRYLEDEIKMPGKRLVASGFSQFRPTASNKTVNGRKKNRRIEVVLLPLAPPAK
ncbi:MAG: OmpA family protein [Deltaproteobacteria bacterium]|nr:OmpA family protein [Deltaproteobacteria bacterium]